MGSAWMLVAAVCFSLMGLLVKIGSANFGVAQQLFARSLIVLVVSWLVLKATRSALTTHRWDLHLSRGLFGYTAMALLFYCIGVLPLATAMTLNYTAPFFLILLSWLILKEPSRLPQIVSVMLGFAGVILLLAPVFADNMITPAMLGLLSGLSLGITNITLRVLGTANEPPWLVVFYFSIISTLVSGIWALFQGNWSPVLADYLTLSGVGLAAAIGQYALTRAYRDGNPVVVATFSYFVLVLSSFYSWLFLGEHLGIRSLAGIAIVIAAGILVSWSSQSRSGKLWRRARKN